ncbi:uncharacterized protein [Watersipora subatra]|uniref:uncharacterized protein n=1 Tax=Watersipora subatra TaxID=2589382 RepID=UPI00355C4364
MMFDTGLELRSKEIQLRRERAEHELQEARKKQRMRHNSAGTLTPASCESTPRRGLSPGNFPFSTSSSDDDDDIRQQRFSGNLSLVTNSAQQKEVERLEEKVKQLKREVDELEEATNELQAEKRAMNRQLLESKDESEDLRIQNSKLQEKLRIRDQEVTLELNKKLEIELTADAEKNKLRQEAVLLESKVSRLNEANTELEGKFASVTAQLNARQDQRVSCIFYTRVACLDYT